MARKKVLKNSSVIIDTAFEMINEHGINNFSTRKLADKLGISKTTAYLYIKNRDEIIESVISRAKIIFQEDLRTLVESVNYKKYNHFDILLFLADVTYDFITKYGNIYRVAQNVYGIAYEECKSIEESFRFMFPVYSSLFNNFKYSDYPEFGSRDFLKKYQYLSILINQLAIIELNRQYRSGKEEYMESVETAWKLITERSLPW